MDYNKTELLQQNYAMPVDAPSYGMQPAIYKDVMVDYCFFTTDLDHVRSILPDCFEASEDGMCVAYALDIPFCTAYGPFQEMGLSVRVNFQGEKYFYQPALFLSNDSAISAGRELYGCPKKLAKFDFGYYEEVFVAKCNRANTDILITTSKILGPGSEDDYPAVFPNLNLKMIPNIDGSGPEIKYITTFPAYDVEMHYVYRTAATVEMHPSVVSSIWKLKPKEILGGLRTCMSYKQGWGNNEFDLIEG